MTVQLIVYGRVQGVGFRYFTKQMADGLGLTGWVMNNIDGTVTIVAEGDRPRLERLIKCLEKGPTYGKIEGIEEEWSQENKGFHTFQIKR